ncbi:hypothetical protein AB0M11_19245 [Streptomyces sp. NPDC051987]|uniref:hypothetical protein n=1 Tax=Streptomyces sp. NPDC051987 TaxID=3155808 RepID=UPI00342EC61A
MEGSVSRVPEHDEPYYVMYDTDFGLSGLAGELSAMPVPYEDPQIGRDARRLLETSLPDDTLRTLWLAATGGRFDPADHGTGTRDWLRRTSEECPPPERRTSPTSTKYLSTIPSGFPPHPAKPEEEVRDAVLAEIRATEAEPSGAALPPDAIPALRQAVAQAGADLGFRLFLRTLKAYAVEVGREQYDRFLALSDRFEYPYAVIRDELNVAWPPVDTTRRETDGDFGLSELTERFAGEWHEATAEEVVRQAAACDHVRQAPGTAAAVLLEDSLRLLESPLSADMLTTLWLAASDGGYAIDRLGIDVRHWLGQIAEVCRERLRDAAPAGRPVPPPSVRVDLAEPVLRELAEVPPGHPIAGSAVLEALAQVVSQVDPDLGFRLFLRVLQVLFVPLKAEQYARYEAIGERLGYGEFHVSNVEFLAQ